MLNLKPIWGKLETHKTALSKQTLQNLFSKDSDRFQRFSLETGGILLDYSKNYLTLETIEYLIQLANECSLSSKIQVLFQGEPPSKENHFPPYPLLRQPESKGVTTQAARILKQIRAQMHQVVQKIRGHRWLGYTQKPVTDVVNIGIGGSDLGSRMVVDALRPYKSTDICCHFISNVDGFELSELLTRLNPETTLFILSSKSFKTPETLCHANTVKHWFLDQAPEVFHTDIFDRHILAITSNPERAIEFGVSSPHIFQLPDWVNGRFSLWTPIGLPIAISIGMERFEELLEGAAMMDEHFATQPLPQNMPVILGLLSVWYINFWNVQTQVIIPYCHLLRHFPAYLQQLEMESNGKSVSLEGTPLNYSTSPSILGGVGTDVQHSFFQWIHQGMDWVPVDFIGVINPSHNLEKHHQLLLASCFAQSQALMQGTQSIEGQKTKALPPEKSMQGSRPSNTILIEELSPYALGGLIALYEHKTLVEGILWNINSFDQWGVELGKNLTESLLNSMKNNHPPCVEDASSAGLLAHYYRNTKKEKAALSVG